MVVPRGGDEGQQNSNINDPRKSGEVRNRIGKSNINHHFGVF
jgi:hypothetical protein